MNAGERQTSRELEIFRCFSAQSGLPIRPASIQKRQPPEPDIFCELEATDFIAFEMVEIVDEAVAHQTYSKIRLKQLFETAYENLPHSNPLRRENSLGNALIHVVFYPNSSFRLRTRCVPGIFKLLEQVTACFSGEIKIDFQSPLRKLVRKVFIGRGAFVGPCFDINGWTWFADPLIDLINENFSKRYSSPSPIELLGYYELQPKPMDWVWSDLRAFVGERLSGSPYRRVWIYDHARRAIRFVYPVMDTK